jgi:hypothetical protein
MPLSRQFNYHTPLEGHLLWNALINNQLTVGVNESGAGMWGVLVDSICKTLKTTEYQQHPRRFLL